MAARLKKNKSRVKQEPRSAHGRAVNNYRIQIQRSDKTILTLILLTRFTWNANDLQF